MRLLAAVFFGWGLGANDAANVFGTAVAAQMVRWRTAAGLIAVAVMAGALLEGGAGLETLGALQEQNAQSALAAVLGAGVATVCLTLLALPVSASQAIVGGILGVGLARGTFSLAGLDKVVLCWVGTPLGAMLGAMILYPILAALVRVLNPHFLTYDALMRALLVLAGVYGAYALGANNVANVTGVFLQAGAFDGAPLSPRFLALFLGGASIGLGALTFSRNVMLTVGAKIVPLDAFSAFVVVLSQALTVHAYAIVGVPVSTSQAVVGAVVGIGLLKGMRTISGRTITLILAGWLVTPVLGAAFGFALFRAMVS